MVILEGNIIQDLISTAHSPLFQGLGLVSGYIVGREGIFIMEDRTLVCKDCGNEFIFTVGEQEFYKEKGFENDPVRCPDCRRARKQQRNNRNFDR